MNRRHLWTRPSEQEVLWTGDPLNRRPSNRGTLNWRPSGQDILRTRDSSGQEALEQRPFEQAFWTGGPLNRIPSTEGPLNKRPFYKGCPEPETLCIGGFSVQEAPWTGGQAL